MVVKKAMRAVDSPNDSCLTQGNGAPEFWFPHPVPPSRVQTWQPGKQRAARVTVAPTLARADPGTGEEAAL
jgi:hypothetical protein